jgi:DNA-directed RNA polymerase subunit E'/Rpb7
MYRILTVEDRIRVPPEKLGLKVSESVRKAIQEKMEGLLDPRLGVVLCVVSIDNIGEGKIGLAGFRGLLSHLLGKQVLQDINVLDDAGNIF